MEEMQVPHGLPVKSVVGPGAMLVEARERLGLDIDNVAQMLHLSEQQIQALESNDYDVLPEPTYVRGYLRGYCQLLGIDPAPVIEHYIQATGVWKTTTYSGLAAEQQVTSQDNLVRLGTYGVVTLVIGLALVWWFSTGGEAERAPAPVAATTELDIPLEPVPATGATEPVNTAPDAVPQPQASGPQVLTPPAPGAPQAVAPVDSVPVEDATSATIENEIKVGQGKTVRTTIIVRARAASWADIRDANGTRLLYENVAAGRSVTLEGTPPIKVFLGNASGIEMIVDGAPYDFSAHKRGMTARFSIEAQSAN